MYSPTHITSDQKRMPTCCPSLDEAWRLLCDAPVPLRKKRHCVAVALGSYRLSQRLEDQGQPSDGHLTLVAGLTHDIARNEKEHAMKGAAILHSFGWDEAAFVVGCHTTLPDVLLEYVGVDDRDTEFLSPAIPDWTEQDWRRMVNATLCVFIADKHANGADFVSIEERFGVILERYSGNMVKSAAIRLRQAIALQVDDYLKEMLRQAPLDVIKARDGSAIEHQLRVYMDMLQD